MKVNVHTHVFNFRSILTSETLVVLKYRLTGIGLPEPIRRLLLSYLKRRLHGRGEVSPRDFMRHTMSQPSGVQLMNSLGKEREQLSQSVIFPNSQSEQLSHSVILSANQNGQISQSVNLFEREGSTTSDSLNFTPDEAGPISQSVILPAEQNDTLSQSVINTPRPKDILSQIVNFGHGDQSKSSSTRTSPRATLIPPNPHSNNMISQSVMTLHVNGSRGRSASIIDILPVFASVFEIGRRRPGRLFRNRRGRISLPSLKLRRRRKVRLSQLINGPLGRRVLRRALKSSSTRQFLLDALVRVAVAAYPSREDLIRNYYEWVRIGLMPSIDEVTDDLMAQLDADDVVVALPMDIIDAENHALEAPLFVQQLTDTRRQALRYPGRVLPFAMLNPLRTDALRVFREAVEDGGCVGLKLYPSLGYGVDGPVVREALALCERLELPVLTHCNDTGFARDARFAQLAGPAPWVALLEEFPGLRVCFAHFGGEVQALDGGVVRVWEQEVLPEGSWARQILGLMERFEGRVFADVSFHVKFGGSAEAQRRYFGHLRGLLADERYRGQILWGTDYHLVRQAVTEREYEVVFRRELGDGLFGLISGENGMRFLGFRMEEGRMVGVRANMVRHLEWLYEQGAGMGGSTQVP